MTSFEISKVQWGVVDYEQIFDIELNVLKCYKKRLKACNKIRYFEPNLKRQRKLQKEVFMMLIMAYAAYIKICVLNPAGVCVSQDLFEALFWALKEGEFPLSKLFVSERTEKCFPSVNSPRHKSSSSC